ncbi:hypothetical protein BDQ17DRAFT_1416002 [Cyathus striatus]|nr:hypothetical protein BDQ17DRAFT_1416002 [Cyathus striatus]
MQPFPFELLQEIFQLACTDSSLANVRLACKSFNETAVPIMFRNAHIRYPSNLEKYLTVLITLAAGEHPWATHARSLTIENPDLQDPDYPFEDERYNKMYFFDLIEIGDPQFKRVETMLKNAVAGFQHVTTVIWRLLNYTSEWSRYGVLSGLEQMTSLKALIIDTNLYNGSLSLESLPPLEVLKIRSSSSYKLPIDGLPTLVTKSSSKLRHLDLLLQLYSSQNEKSFLSSLVKRCVVTRVGGISTAGDTWRMLKDEQIHLEHISHIEPTESLLQFFGSYSGLKSLEFNKGDYGEMDEISKQLTLNDYLNALSNHVSSLENLTIVHAREEGDWCFAEGNVTALSQFINLKYLSITILADSGSTVQRGQGIRYYDLNEDDYAPSHSVSPVFSSTHCVFVSESN